MRWEKCATCPWRLSRSWTSPGLHSPWWRCLHLSTFAVWSSPLTILEMIWWRTSATCQSWGMFRLSPMPTVNVCQHQWITGGWENNCSLIKIYVFLSEFGNSCEKFIPDWEFILLLRANIEKKWYFKQSNKKFGLVLFLTLFVHLLIEPQSKAFFMTHPSAEQINIPLILLWISTKLIWR